MHVVAKRPWTSCPCINGKPNVREHSVSWTSLPGPRGRCAGFLKSVERPTGDPQLAECQNRRTP